MKLPYLTLLFILLFSCDNPPEPGAVKVPKTDSSKQPESSNIEVVEFKKLTGFELPLPDQTMAGKSDLEFINEAVPENIRTLNSKKIVIKGFMIPLKYTKDEKISSFLLAPDQGACCLGKAPALNGIIYCSLETPCPDLRDILLEVKGTFSTTAEFNRTDNTVYVYRMTVDDIKELKLMPPAKGPGLSF